MLELRAGEALVVVDLEGGGRIARVAVAGRDLLTDAGLFLMAPWPGRTGRARFVHDGVEHRLAADLPPHALHGTVRGVAWTVELSSTTTARLGAPLGPGWPWPGWCEHTVAVRADRLELTAEVRAGADGPAFPAAVGWHPWFRKPASVTMDVDSMLERGGDGLPTGRRVPPVRPGGRPLDDCFEGVRWPVVLRWPDGFRLQVGATGCDHVVVYDEQRDTTCVEPQTAPPDALNQGGAALVEPRRPLRAGMTMRWG